MTSPNLPTPFIIPPNITLSLIPYTSIKNGLKLTILVTNPIAIKIKEMKYKTALSIKNRSMIPGAIATIVHILNISKGPFLSEIKPKIGPTIIIETPCMTVKNCKAPPSMPINAPNVLPVVIINDIGKLTKKEAKAILQNLKVLIIFLIFLFLKATESSCPPDKLLPYLFLSFSLVDSYSLFLSSSLTSFFLFFFSLLSIFILDEFLFSLFFFFLSSWSLLSSFSSDFFFFFFSFSLSFVETVSFLSSSSNSFFNLFL